jgi:hypothetical protein
MPDAIRNASLGKLMCAAFCFACCLAIVLSAIFDSGNDKDGE